MYRRATGKTLRSRCSSRFSGRWRRNRSLLLEPLEERRLLCTPVSGHIDRDTTWNDPEYCLVGDVIVDPGVTLSIGSQVRVETDGSHTLSIEDGILVASGARFGVRLRVFSGDVSEVDNNIFSLSEPIWTNPSLVEDFYGNTFENPNTTIGVQGGLWKDTNWRPIPNLPRYRLLSYSHPLWMPPGTTLTIEPGVEVYSDEKWDSIIVDGTLDGSGVTFTGLTNIRVRDGGTMNLTDGSIIAGQQVDFEEGSSGRVANSEFKSALLRVLTICRSVEVDNNTFSLAAPIHTNPSLVPGFYDNEFKSATTTVGVQGKVCEDAAWYPVDNLSRYRLLSYSHPLWMPPGTTLTIEPGVEVYSDEKWDSIIVDGTLDGSGVAFTGLTNIRVRDGGTMNLTDGSIISGQQVDFEEGSSGRVANSEFKSALLRVLTICRAVEVDNNTFSLAEPIHTNPSLVPGFYDNEFKSATTTVGVQGKVCEDAAWYPVDNLSRYRLLSYSHPLWMPPGTTLTIEPGVEVYSDEKWDSIIVDGTLDGSGVTFTGLTNIRVRDGGTMNLTDGSIISGQRVDFEEGSSGSVVSSRFKSKEVHLRSGSGGVIQNTEFENTLFFYSDSNFFG